MRFGGLKAERRDVIQVDPPQAYGIVQYARTLAMLERHGWPRSGLFPHGGNQMSLPSPAASASAARNPIPACSARSPASPTMRRLENGYLTLSDRPGIGFEGQAALYRIMRDLAA